MMRYQDDINTEHTSSQYAARQCLSRERAWLAKMGIHGLKTKILLLQYK